jgi:hypothetical protein
VRRPHRRTPPPTPAVAAGVSSAALGSSCPSLAGPTSPSRRVVWDMIWLPSFHSGLIRTLAAGDPAHARGISRSKRLTVHWAGAQGAHPANSRRVSAAVQAKSCALSPEALFEANAEEVMVSTHRRIALSGMAAIRRRCAGAPGPSRSPRRPLLGHAVLREPAPAGRHPDERWATVRPGRRRLPGARRLRIRRTRPARRGSPLVGRIVGRSPAKSRGSAL